MDPEVSLIFFPFSWRCQQPLETRIALVDLPDPKIKTVRVASVLSVR